MSQNNQLERIKLDNVQLQGELVLLTNGLNQNDQIITSDLFPAVNGMLVEPIADDKTQAKLMHWLEQVQ